MPTVAGILETALYVADVDRSVAFYRALFAFPLILAEARLAALRVGERDVLLLFRRGASADPDGGGLPHDAHGEMHLAFAVGAADLGAWRERLGEERIAIEREIAWDGGARSLYFRDPDRHLAELVTPGLWSLSWE
jgi:catechol 2,3-dioxygenase-like lactoylglutathione lyase family enzyme